MLHLTLVANVLNAIGGSVDLTRPGFVPAYPAYLPDGETDFRVDLQRFSPAAVETFLKIERPADLAPEGIRTLARAPNPAALAAARVAPGSEEHFFSIGEFYAAIESGLKFLHAQMGDRLFSGDPARQIGPEQYYSGGGALVRVTDLESALAALDLIAEQGEGVHSHVHDEDGEIAHYYRFHQLVAGRRYRDGDAPHAPTGEPVEVDWTAVFPLRSNPRQAELPEGDVRRTAEAFDRAYAEFLALLTRAFSGAPHLFPEAVGGMFHVKDLFGRLVRMPIDGGEHAAPCFEIDAVRGLA